MKIIITTEVTPYTLPTTLSSPQKWRRTHWQQHYHHHRSDAVHTDNNVIITTEVTPYTLTTTLSSPQKWRRTHCQQRCSHMLGMKADFSSVMSFSTRLHGITA